jgi:putative ABC transport system substrate-binding protein
LLHDLIPNAALFGVLADPAFPPTQSTIAELQAAARTLGLQLVIVYARTDSDLESAFASFSQQRAGAVLVSDSNFFSPMLRARRSIQRDSNFAKCAAGASLPEVSRA